MLEILNIPFLDGALLVPSPFLTNEFIFGVIPFGAVPHNFNEPDIGQKRGKVLIVLFDKLHLFVAQLNSSDVLGSLRVLAHVEDEL